MTTASETGDAAEHNSLTPRIRVGLVRIRQIFQRRGRK